jgi:chromatin assembly factor 1 subunit A
MPVDLVYISNNVAVPKSKISTATGRPTKEYTKYLKEHRELLDFESKAVNNQEVYEFTPDRLAALRGFQQQHGMQFSPGVAQKLENGEAFTAIEKQELFDGVGAQLALNHLDGTRLRTAGLQSDLADAGIVTGDTLISPVRGKASTFEIKAKGLANAIRVLKNQTIQPIEFFNTTASASFRNFERSVQFGANAAPKQVIANIKRATEAQGSEAINVQSSIYMDMGVQLERSSRKSVAIRADQPQISDVSPTARKDFVGASPYEQKFRNRLQKKIEQKRQARAEKKQQRIKSLSKIKTQQEESFAKLTEAQEESLAKLVEKQKVSIENLTTKQRASLAKLMSSKKKIKNKQQKIAEKIAKQKKFYEERLAKQQEIVSKRKEKQQEIRTTRATEQKEIFDKKVKAAVESEMKDLQKLSEEESKINNQIDEYIKNIREDQISKSKETAKRRTLQAASERYGHKQVKDFIEDTVGYKNLEYEDLATVIDDLVDYMDVYEEGFIRYSQWEDVLKNFFVGPEIAIKQKKVISTSEILKFVREEDQLLKMIVEDPEQPFFAPNNLKPINPSKLKEVVEGLRKGPGGDILQKYGLKKGIFSRDENFVLPILQKMMSIQKLQNTQEAIAKFARTEPDFVLSMKRTQEGMVGLESVEAISEKVEQTIRDTLAAGDKMKIFSDDLKNIVFYQIKEILFDGMMRDVWVNTSRSTQEKFLQKYLNKMVLEETVAINMDDFLRTVIIAEKDKTPLIRSKTFDRINERLENVLKTVADNLEYARKAKDAKVSVIEKKQKLVKQIKESLPDMIKTMNVEYLGKLTGIGKGPLSDSLFAQQIQQVTDRMTMYGLSGNALSKALKSINPRIKMIGNENLALVYGQELAERAKLITEMTESKYFESVFKSQAFNKYAQQAFKKDVKGTINRGEILTQIALNTVFGTLNMFRRWTTAAMLGGQFAPNTRFFGFNRLTAPFILAGTVLNAPLRLPSVARIIGRSFDMGLERPAKSAFNTFMRKIGKPHVWDLSAANKLQFAPPEEVVVFAKDGAKRDYTAGELRRIINESGMEYSRADAEFFDSEVNSMLIELGINEQGLNRYRSQQPFLRNNPWLYETGKKLLENARTSQNNIFTQLSKYQDSELRRVAFVEYLRNGYSLEEAVAAGKSSMLDYSILSDFEKQHISNVIWFYAFQRTMMTSQINAIYKSVMTGKPSLSLRMLRSQDVLNRQMAEDYNDYTNQQLGRVYNIFAGQIDKIPLTVGGPPNPQMQLLDVISTGLVASQSSELAEALFVYLAEQKPYMGIYIKYERAKESGRIPPFPSYLQYDAEASGNLEYFIERYGLIPKRKMPGKTLTMGSEETDAGVLYDFPDGEKGLQGYKRYLYDEAAGLTAAGVLIRQGLDVLSREEGIPVNDLIVRLFGQRFKRDLTKAEMLSSKRGDRIVTPEGEEVVPFEGRYLKSGTIQGGKISEVFEGDTQSAILWSLYQLGLATPLKGAPAEKNIIYQLNRVHRALDQADKESQ